MKINYKILRIFLLTIFGILFSYKLYQTGQDDFFLDGIIFIILGALGFVVFIWTLLKDHKEFKESKKVKSYFSTFLGLLFILTLFGQYYYQDNKINSPTLICGFYDGGFNGFSVDFKTDGKYVMANGSGLGESYFYGTYTICDSIITIDKFEIDNCIKTNRLVIREDDYYSKDSIDLLKSKANYITQIDKNGIEIDKEFRFRVTKDNRYKSK